MPRPRRLYVRASDDEIALLDLHAGALNLDRSAYIRSLAAIPVALVAPGQADPATEADSGTGGSVRLLVYDKKAFHDLTMQIRRWGYHYNQAVHALNTIASKGFMRPEDAEQLLGRANAKLAEVESMRAEFFDAVSEIERGCRLFVG